MKYARLIGTGSYLPEHILTNEELSKRIETSDDWIWQRAGIRSRHTIADGQSTTNMAEIAARQAIDAAGIPLESIDLIIGTTSSPDYIFPSMACILQRQLGIKSCPAFDLQAACSGFIYALSVANQFIRSGAAKTVLIACSEASSRIMNWEDRTTCVLFGDGAGAVVLTASDEPGLLATLINAAGEYGDLLYVPNPLPGQQNQETHAHMKMRGKEVFKVAVNTLGAIAEQILTENNIEQSELDWLIPHQANVRIIEATAKKLGLSMEQVVLTIAKQGNTSSASIPLALNEAIRDGRVKPGQLLLLEAFGGGFAWGAALLRY